MPRGLRPSQNKRTGKWVRVVKAALRTYDGAGWREHVPVHVGLEFRFSRPRGHYMSDGVRLSKAGRRFREPTGRNIGDGDKLTRAVWDCLVGPVIADDSQISAWSGSKRWCQPGEQPGCTITVRSYTMDCE